MTSKTTLSLMILSLPALAGAEVDTSEWLCETCPFDDGYRAEFEAGVTSVNDNAARFGSATGYDEEGIYANVDGDGVYAKDDYRMTWRIEDLALDSRIVEVSAGKPGVFDVSVGLRDLPYRRFDTTQTVFLPSTSDSLSLPAGWVRGGTTGGMTALSTALRPQDIQSDRRILDLGTSWTLMDRIDVWADFQRQQRDGIKITGGSSFTQSSLLPRFIDYETDQIDAGVRLAFDRGHLGLAWYGSFFTNQNDSLTWETPFLTAPGAESLRMASSPDNDFQQFSLSGAFAVNTWDTNIAFSLANGRGEQNESLLPYTINPNVGSGVLPRATAGAEVDTANYALRITSRPVENGRVRFSYRHDERDNRTPVDTWSRVIVDVFDSGEIEQNVPYGYERTNIGISGEIIVWKGMRISGGYDRKELSRDYQEVAKQTTDAGWGQLRWRPLDWLDLRIKGGTDKRDIDRYDETVAVSFGQNPLLRKYNLAYRFRSYGELVATMSPSASRWSVTTTAMLTDDRYTKSLLGMTDSEELRITADFSLAISERASLFLLAGVEEIEALQTGSEQFASWDWLARHKDTFMHIGAGGRWRDADDRFDVRVDLNRGKGETSIWLDSQSGGPSVLPDLDSTLDSFRVTGRYRLTERLSATLDLRFESFELSDWALVAPDAMPTVLTLGAQPYDYDIWALGLGIRYALH